MTEENKNDVDFEQQIEDIEINDDGFTDEELLGEMDELPEELEKDSAEDQLQEEIKEQLEDDEPTNLDDEVEANIEAVIEAILFASDEPLSKARLIKIAELSSAKQVTDAVKTLNERYKANNSAFRIEQIAGGYQMMTLPIFNSWLRKMMKVKTDSKLSQAALETLAIVSYKQPIIRADVEAIRGVASGEIIRSLMYKGLVKIVGRAEVIGRPLLYGTTKKFLEVFGLNSLKDLPSVDELKKPE